MRMSFLTAINATVTDEYKFREPFAVVLAAASKGSALHVVDVDNSIHLPVLDLLECLPQAVLVCHVWEVGKRHAGHAMIRGRNT